MIEEINKINKKIKSNGNNKKNKKAQMIMEYTIMFSLAVMFLVLMLAFISKQVDDNLDKKHYSALEMQKNILEEKINALLIAKEGYEDSYYFSGYKEGIKMTLNMTKNLMILNTSRKKVYLSYPEINASFQINNGTLLFKKENNTISITVQ